MNTLTLVHFLTGHTLSPFRIQFTVESASDPRFAVFFENPSSEFTLSPPDRERIISAVMAKGWDIEDTRWFTIRPIPPAFNPRNFAEHLAEFIEQAAPPS